MKKNEPVRSGGIGRKQIAWQTGKALSQGSTIQDLLQEQSDEFSTQANQAQHMATLSNATAMSRAIAYSAASSAIVTNQNDVWSTQSIQDWTHFGSSFGPSSSYIKWANPDPDNLLNIRSPLAYVDSEDPTIVRVNRPGWYLVSVNFYQGDHSLNNYVNELTVVSADSVDTTTARAKMYSHGYPSLGICQVVPVPGYGASGNAASPNDIQSKGGFIAVYTIGAHNGNLSITAANSYASMQIIWLRPWEENFFYNGA
jgi:hypothetical protein